jgi:hypothetical protein
VHQSSVHAAREQGDPAPEDYATISIKQMRQNGAPKEIWEGTGLWTTALGHGWMGDYHDDSRLVAGLDTGVPRHTATGWPPSAAPTRRAACWA